MSVIGAISLQQVLAVMTLNGSMNGDAFQVFIEQCLLPQLWQGAVAIQILLAFTKILGVEPSWINFVYLKAKYGSLYWLMPLGGIIMILIISSINLLDYRYEFLPLRYGYKYSLKISENIVKQIRTDRIACGILNIFFLMLLLLMVVKLFGTVINPSFDVPNQVISLLASAYFLITVLITIVYHIKSSNLAKLDRQQKKSLDRDNHEVL